MLGTVGQQFLRADALGPQSQPTFATAWHGTPLGITGRAADDQRGASILFCTLLTSITCSADTNPKDFR
jgi:hypothetical protein